jgi:hypothetical protein
MHILLLTSRHTFLILMPIESLLVIRTLHFQSDNSQVDSWKNFKTLFCNDVPSTVTIGPANTAISFLQNISGQFFQK